MARMASVSTHSPIAPGDDGGDDQDHDHRLAELPEEAPPPRDRRRLVQLIRAVLLAEFRHARGVQPPLGVGPEPREQLPDRGRVGRRRAAVGMRGRIGHRFEGLHVLVLVVHGVRPHPVEDIVPR